MAGKRLKTPPHSAKHVGLTDEKSERYLPPDALGNRAQRRRAAQMAKRVGGRGRESANKQ